MLEYHPMGNLGIKKFEAYHPSTQEQAPGEESNSVLAAVQL